MQVMMERMGGGGHLNIAGAQVKATEDETEKMRLQMECERLKNELRIKNISSKAR